MTGSDVGRRLAGGARGRPGAHALTAGLALLLALVACVAAPAADTATGAAPDTADGGDGSSVPAASGAPVGHPRIDGLDSLIRDRLAQRDLRGTDVSVLIATRDGAVLYDREPDRPLIPASNMKLVTGACALSEMGQARTFETLVGTDGTLSDGVLSGNLYVRGRGDPALVSEELWNICDALRARGVARIAGDLVLDTTWFDGADTATPDADDGDRAYHARTGALSLNFNAIAVHVYPGAGMGNDAVVSVSPDVGLVELRSSARTGSSRRGSTLEVRRTFEDGRNVVTVTGRIPEGSPGRTYYRNLDDPASAFGTAMAGFLSGAGVTLEGRRRLGVYPDDATLLHRHESKPLSLIVRDLGKYSSNFAAEQLVKVLAAERFGPPGTTAGGARILSDYLVSVGVDSSAFRIVDGSGLSRGNRLTTRTLVTVLRSALLEFKTSYEFAASLSVSGTDGTLEDRMGFPGLSKSVRAKTGLLDGVTAMSGILRTVAGDEVLFSIITNGFECEAWRLHDLEHEILAQAARNVPPLSRAAAPE
ncbi:MAG: D-alanyl-D-alanine carboxypeptidase/D-alanyl-D-alanine-endopeptidase [Candidatus Eisenbacteria bacterium]